MPIVTCHKVKSFSQIFLSIACSITPLNNGFKVKQYPYLLKFVLTHAICNALKINDSCMKFGTLPDVQNNPIARLTIACQNTLIKFSEIDHAYITKKYLNNENLLFNLSDLSSQLSGPFSADLKISAINIISLIIKTAKISGMHFEKSNFVELNHKIIENVLLILKKYSNDAYSVSCSVDFLSCLLSTNNHGQFVHKFLLTASNLTGDELMNTLAVHINKFSYEILASIRLFVSEIINQKFMQFFELRILSKAIAQKFGEYLNSEDDFSLENLLSFLSIFKLFLDTKTKSYFTDLMAMLHRDTSLIRFVGKIFNCLSSNENNQANDKLISALKDFFLNYNAINYASYDTENQEIENYTLIIAKSAKVTVKCIQMLLENSKGENESKQEILPFAFMLLNIFLQKMVGDDIDYSQIFSDLVTIFSSLNDQDDLLCLSFDVLPLIVIILQADPSIINQKMTDVLMICEATVEFLNETNLVKFDDPLKFTHCFNFLLIFMGNLADRASSKLIHKFKVIDLIENYLTCSYARAEENFELISTLLSFLQAVFAQESIVSDQVSVRIYKLIGIQLSDAMKNLNHQQKIILLSHALNLAKLASLNAVDVYENLASFFASHNVVIEDFLNESDVITNFDESETLQLLLKMLELMLNSNYKLCLREFKSFFTQIVQFISQINSAVLKIQISIKTSNSKIHGEDYFVNIIKLSSALISFTNQRTLPVIDLVFKDMQFESDDLYYFNTTNINKSFQNWIDFSQSLSFAMNMLSSEENKIIYFPIVRQSLEILCSVAISQLYMLKKLNMFDDLAEDFYSNLKALLNLFSNKHFKSSPIQSPGLAIGSPARHMKSPAITIDQEVKQSFFGIVEYAFK